MISQEKRDLAAVTIMRGFTREPWLQPELDALWHPLGLDVSEYPIDWQGHATLNDYNNWLHNLGSALPEVPPAERTSIIAESGAGKVALSLFARHPDRINRLVLINSKIDPYHPDAPGWQTSPSKMYGVFDHRLMGVPFTREQVGTLVETVWFKDIPKMFKTMMLYDTFGLDTLPALYAARQLEACKAIADLIGSEIRPSDTLLMATADDPTLKGYGHLKLTANGERVGFRFRLPRVFEILDDRDRANKSASAETTH